MSFANCFSYDSTNGIKVIVRTSFNPKFWYNTVCNVYNMIGRVVLNIQSRAEGECSYIQYGTDASVVNNLKRKHGNICIFPKIINKAGPA